MLIIIDIYTYDDFLKLAGKILLELKFWRDLGENGLFTEIGLWKLLSILKNKLNYKFTERTTKKSS